MPPTATSPPTPPRAVAEAAGWKKKPLDFWNALFAVRLLDRVEERVGIHNWDRYQSLLIKMEEEQRERARERVRRHREKKKLAALSSSEPTTLITLEHPPILRGA